MACSYFVCWDYSNHFNTHGPKEAEEKPVSLKKKKIGFQFVRYLVFKKWKMTEQLFQ